MALAYRTAEGPISYTQGNLIVAAARAKFMAAFGGKDWLLAYKTTGSASSSAGTTYFGGPGHGLFGKCFFFNDGGPTPFSIYFPDCIMRSATVADPILGATAITRARTYNHAPFVAAAAALTLLSQDDGQGIATVANATIPDFTDGLRDNNVGSVSLFDHSLCAHGRLLAPAGSPPGTTTTKYYLKETGVPTNEKRYTLAVAEIVIEGLDSVTLPVDTQYPNAIASKYCCLRVHNLQPRACVTNLGTFPPFSCICIRRDWNETTKTFENIRTTDYFFDYVSGDPLGFLSFAHSVGATQGDFATAAQVPAAAMQGNNIANLGYFCDLFREFAGNSNLYAQLFPDPHELCDMGALAPAELAEKFACLRPEGGFKTDAKIGDLFHHTGRVRIAKVHKTTQAPPPDQSYKLEEWDEVEFTGYEDLAALTAAFLAKGIDVTEVGGRLEFKPTTAVAADWSVDLIHSQTNCLKNADHGGATYWYVLRQGATIDSGYQIESKIFENTGGFAQDADGFAPFNQSATGSYKIFGREVNETVRARQYVNDAGVLTTVTGEASRALVEKTHVANASVTGIHSVPVDDIESLKYIGDPSLSSQDDGNVVFENSRLVMTPQGWVLKFTESVRGDVLPQFTATVKRLDQTEAALTGLRPGVLEGDRIACSFSGANIALGGIWLASTGAWVRAPDQVIDGFIARVTDSPANSFIIFQEATGHWLGGGSAVAFTGSTAYVNSLGTEYQVDAATGRFEKKHLVRFRKHGWPFHQHGRVHAAFQSPFHGRLTGGATSREVVGPNGADYALTGSGPAESAVKVLRNYGLNDLTCPGAGARFWRSAANWPLDSLLAVERNHGTPYWYQKPEPTSFNPTPRERIRGQAEDGSGYSRKASVSSQVFMPLMSWNYNMLAEMLNQFTFARPLSWKSLRFVYGAKVLSFDSTEGTFNPDLYFAAGGLTDWQTYFGNTPAPLDALLSIATGTNEAHWRALFSQLGVPEKTGVAADLPASWDAFRSVVNQTRTLSATLSTTISNASYNGFREVWLTGLGQSSKWHNFDATLAASFSASLTAPANGSVGLAVVAVSGFGNSVQLTTAYTAKRWIDSAGLKSLCTALSFEMKHSEPVIPLVLDHFEKPDTVDPIGSVLGSSLVFSYHDEVFGLSGNAFASPATLSPAQIQTFINHINATTCRAFGTGGTFDCRRVAFKLFGDNDPEGSTAEWKLPVPTGDPPLAYSATNRSEGHDPSIQYFLHPVSEYTATDGAGFGATGLVDGVGDGKLGPWVGRFPYAPVPPWTAPETTGAWPNMTLPPPSTQVAGVGPATNGTQALRWNGSGYFRNYIPGGPRFSVQLETPTNPEKLRRVENFVRWQQREQKWFAANIIGTGSSQEFYLVPQPHWGAELDWWEQSIGAYLSLLFGSNSYSYVPPRDIPVVGSAGMITATEGVTVLKPETEGAVRIMFSPNQFLISLE